MDATARAKRAEFVVAQQRAMLDLLVNNNYYKAEYDKQMNAMLHTLKEAKWYQIQLQMWTRVDVPIGNIQMGSPT